MLVFDTSTLFVMSAVSLAGAVAYIVTLARVEQSRRRAATRARLQAIWLADAKRFFDSCPR